MSQGSSGNSHTRFHLNPYNKPPNFKTRCKDLDKLYNNRNYPKYYNHLNTYPLSQPRGYFRRKKRYKTQPQPECPRPPSPLSGTEEYTLRKIQETSEMIKKQLMMPPQSANTQNSTKTQEKSETSFENSEIPEEKTHLELDKAGVSKTKKQTSYNVEEIHQKIITHISNLNHGRKMNLISSHSSGYDEAIQQIYKQKRLEISKVLREMCSNQNAQNSETINAIIPDIGIKIEDLPLELIKELSTTLDLNLNEEFNDEFQETKNIPIIKREIKIENPEIIDFCDENCIPKGEIETISCQIDSIHTSSNEVQTDFENLNKFPDEMEVDNLDDAIGTMFEIDEEIARLTKLRQSIFQKLQSKSLPNEYNQELNFDVNNEKILVLQILENTLLAASESGKIFFINLANGATMHILNITTVPITAFTFCKGLNLQQLFVGTFEPHLYCYNFKTKKLHSIINLGDSVQCMEIAWDYIFIGATNGSLIRYSMKLSRVEFKDTISDNSVLVLKATQEGARRVLLVGTRNQPVCIRDALTGLHMRTMDDLIAPTVYSLILDKSLVYCGTTSHDILVYKFHDGSLVCKLNTTNAKGISCLKIVNNLLFASCYNGHIYIYNTITQKFLGQIKGPGGVILSMEVYKNIVIIGTMNFNFKSLFIPQHFLFS